MPVFTAKIDNVAKWYGNMAEGFKKLFDAGNLEGLKQAKYGGKYEGGLVWKPGFSNGEKIAAYHAQLVAILEQKKAAGVLAGAQQAAQALTAQATAPVAATVATRTPKAPAKAAQPPAQQSPSAPPSPSAMPNFDAKLMAGESGNAKSNNKKVLQIKQLAEKGDVTGLLSLAYGSNTYGKQHVILANDALAALGSPHKVLLSQKPGSHPALTGGATPEQVAVAAATLKKPAPKPHPVIDESKLDMSKAPTLEVPKFAGSSKPWVNDQNNALAQEIQEIYQSGNLVALKAMTYKVIDKETGKETGEVKHISESPAKALGGMFDQAVGNLKDIANPPEPLKIFDASVAASIAAIDRQFPSKPMGTVVSKQAKNEQLGYWLALGKLEGAEKFVPPKQQNLSPQAIKAAYAKYKSATETAKLFIAAIQQSGSFADAYRDGKEKYGSLNLKEAAEAALAHATEHPPGTKLYRWSSMPDAMIKTLLSTEPGTVFQATGPMPTSYDPIETKDFGSNRMEIIFAPGAKAVDSFGSGKYVNEKEVTTLPNARFVLLSSKPISGGFVDIKVLMLPPDLGLGKKPKRVKKSRSMQTEIDGDNAAEGSKLAA
jgi:hypothetical protein